MDIVKNVTSAQCPHAVKLPDVVCSLPSDHFVRSVSEHGLRDLLELYLREASVEARKLHGQT